MIGEDERGYLLSGMGLLLLIPVFILIPVALSVQEHSASIPSTFTKSDTLYNTFKAIQRDMTSKVYDYGLNATNITYSYNQSSLFANKIKTLYNYTNKDLYQSAYGQTVDTLDIKPANPNLVLNMNNVTGIMPLKNGIVLYYNLTGFGPVGSNIMYNYTFTTEINIIIELTKSNSGHNQTFDTRYEFPLYIDTSTNDNATASDRINQFFNGINSEITDIV